MENMTSKDKSNGSCPFFSGNLNQTGGCGSGSSHWWHNKLRMNILRQNSSLTIPMKADFDYQKEFESLDFEALKQDLSALMTHSQDWWLADLGHFGVLFARMERHTAAT